MEKKPQKFICTVTLTTNGEVGITLDEARAWIFNNLIGCIGKNEEVLVYDVSEIEIGGKQS